MDNQKIVGYRIARGHIPTSANDRDGGSIEVRVQHFLKQGWSVYGNPFSDGSGYACQAMVKYE